MTTNREKLQNLLNSVELMRYQYPLASVRGQSVRLHSAKLLAVYYEIPVPSLEPQENEPDWMAKFRLIPKAQFRLIPKDDTASGLFGYKLFTLAFLEGWIAFLEANPLASEKFLSDYESCLDNKMLRLGTVNAMKDCFIFGYYMAKERANTNQ